MRQQFVAAAINGLLRHDMLSRLRKRLNGIGDGRRTGSQRQGGHAAFQRRQTLLQYILRRVGQPAVDVAEVRQPETGCRVSRVFEHVRGGLINGHRPGISGRIGLLLANVKLERLKMIRLLTHKAASLSFCFSFLWQGQSANRGVER